MTRSTKALVALVLAVALSACATMPMAGPTLADRAAIEATLYRYARGLDRHDADLYASAWAEEGEFQLGQRLYRGRQDMRGIIAGLVESSAAAAARGEPARQIFHMDANERIEFFAPDRAMHHAYYLTLARTGEGLGSPISVVDVGSVTDEMRKIGGEWLIVRRDVKSGP